MLSSQERQTPTEFELIFVHQDVHYQYGLVLDRELIHEEWLIAFPKGQPQTWFECRLREAELAETEHARKPTLFDGLPGSPGFDNDRYTWYFGPNPRTARESPGGAMLRRRTEQPRRRPRRVDLPLGWHAQRAASISLRTAATAG